MSGQHVPATPKLAEIQLAVCARTGVAMRELRSASRRRPVARARQLAMYLARALTPRTTGEIGQAFDRDHSTVINGARMVAFRLRYDPDLARDVEVLTARLTGSRCRCAACSASAARFPLDPPQLLLPLRWPGELKLELVAA